ncbi:MAG: DUF6074 family protein [Aliihoeflea sp.]|uniref:DUF6074 family protein n=1 Tax=Aliihoeflea sp. 40Bstr573 TaxID=2696467 RepID=UPI002095DCCB|nr:DUF6074 family protein [Aliihoeflea sp. 40Bstr573]MCO6386396.1 hypothetical protein [Aliihoeflea sp. 40Bstr573]
MNEQLSPSNAAAVLPFPLRARTAAVRHAVKALTVRCLTEDMAVRRWIRVTDALASELQRVGIDPVVIATELYMFEDAVRDELVRLGKMRDGPIY